MMSPLPVEAEARGGREFWVFKLYVAGQSPQSLRAITNLTELCEAHLAGSYKIEIIDLVDDPQRAQDDDILAIPTLVLRLPTPLRKVIGDLSNTEKVLIGLHLAAEDAS